MTLTLNFHVYLQVECPWAPGNGGGHFVSAVAPSHPPIGIGVRGDSYCPTPEASVVVFEFGVLDVREPVVCLYYRPPELTSVVADKLRFRDGEICHHSKQTCSIVSWHGTEASHPKTNIHETIDVIGAVK